MSLDKSPKLLTSATLIDSKDDIKKNMENTELLLQSKDIYLRDLIKNGINFVYYKFNGQDRFLPSRYVGYKNISVVSHSEANNLDGRKTDKILSSKLGKKESSSKLKNMLDTFIQKMYGDEYSSNNHKHSFWKTDICLYSGINQLDEEIYKEVAKINSERGNNSWPDFRSYGRVRKKPVLRTVLYQDRDPQVVADALKLAKGVCQGCGADEKKLFKRASDGEVYLEVHHIVPLSEDGSDTLDNACALCPMCHRLLHYGKESDVKKVRRNIDKTMKKREELIKQILEKQ